MVEKVVADILFLTLLVILLPRFRIGHTFKLSLFHTSAGSPRRRFERDTRRKRLPPSLLRFKPESWPASSSPTRPSLPSPPFQECPQELTVPQIQASRRPLQWKIITDQMCSAKCAQQNVHNGMCTGTLVQPDSPC